jgi:hypothetical protein
MQSLKIFEDFYRRITHGLERVRPIVRWTHRIPDSGPRWRADRIHN